MLMKLTSDHVRRTALRKPCWNKRAVNERTWTSSTIHSENMLYSQFFGNEKNKARLEPWSSRYFEQFQIPLPGILTELFLLIKIVCHIPIFLFSLGYNQSNVMKHVLNSNRRWWSTAVRKASSGASSRVQELDESISIIRQQSYRW